MRLSKIICALMFLFFLFPAIADARDIVPFNSGYQSGTIVIDTHKRQLYFVLGSGQALRYPVGVGRAGMQWSGTARIEGKYIRPAWAPSPGARIIPGGSPHNPMGAAAMPLTAGDYAIHGTNDPGSIGHDVSHGCIRMHNADVRELFGYVEVGTPVIVLR